MIDGELKKLASLRKKQVPKTKKSLKLGSSTPEG
jgi:hypothetical protein